MDVFYLGVAYISTMRNWVNMSAFNVSRCLFFYRQIGVVAFELSGVRALLLIFPNTFEYFFITYEGIRSRWNTARFQMKFWVITAALIWVVVKLPQEWWIHIAQLDFTDTVRDVPWFGPACIAGILVLAAVFWFYVRPRLAPADHGWQIVAPPIPAAMNDQRERSAYMAEYGKVWSVASLEKVLLIGLIFIIFASIVPNADVSNLRLFLWVAVFVLVNAVISLSVARRHWSTDSVLASFGARVLINAGLIISIDALWRGNNMPLSAALFFLWLFCVLITLYDRYRPIYEYRLHVHEVANA